MPRGLYHVEIGYTDPATKAHCSAVAVVLGNGDDHALHMGTYIDKQRLLWRDDDDNVVDPPKATAPEDYEYIEADRIHQIHKLDITMSLYTLAPVGLPPCLYDNSEVQDEFLTNLAEGLTQKEGFPVIRISYQGEDLTLSPDMLNGFVPWTFKQILQDFTSLTDGSLPTGPEPVNQDSDPERN